MVILGCKPASRFVEQHDVFFGISSDLIGLKQGIYDFWPEAEKGLHIDSYRIVRKVAQYAIEVVEKCNYHPKNGLKLYFLNLGGYKLQDMEEYHYKQLVVAESMDEAVAIATENVFCKHHVSPHVDNKYGIDVDDAYLVEDMLPNEVRRKYCIQLRPTEDMLPADDLIVGYLELDKLI